MRLKKLIACAIVFAMLVMLAPLHVFANEEAEMPPEHVDGEIIDTGDGDPDAPNTEETDEETNDDGTEGGTPDTPNPETDEETNDDGTGDGAHDAPNPETDEETNDNDVGSGDLDVPNNEIDDESDHEKNENNTDEGASDGDNLGEEEEDVEDIEEGDEEDDEEGDEEEEDEPEENYPVLDILEVTIPTTGVLDFLIDPQGLSGLAEGESVALRELAGGKIYPMSNIPASVLNESSFPIVLTVDIRAHSTAGGGENTDTVCFVPFDTDFERTKASVFDGDGHNVLLYVVPSGNEVRTVYDAYVPADIGFVITDNPIRLSYILPAAEYILIGEGEDSRWQLVDGTGNGIQLQVGGYVNSNANWMNFTNGHVGSAPSAIGLTAMFSYTRLEFDGDEQIYAAPFAGIAHLQHPMTRNSPGYVVLDAESQKALTTHPAIYAAPQLPHESAHDQLPALPPDEREYEDFEN